jgi:dihydroflavonol-4-reductase
VRVLVTGATGFIGHNLVYALLKAGYQVRILYRANSDSSHLNQLNLEATVGNVEERESLRGVLNGCDGVIHLAARFSLWPRDYDNLYRTNVTGTGNLVDEAMRSGVRRFVHVSTVGTIGLTETPVLLDERSPYNLTPYRFPYHETKHLAERLVLAACKWGLNGVIVNPSLVIGPHDYRIQNVLLGPVLRTWPFCWFEGGCNVASVGDIVQGIIAALERGQTGERYILGGENLSYETQLKTVTEMAGRPGPVVELNSGLVRVVAGLSSALHPLVPLPSYLSPKAAQIFGLWGYCTSAKAEQELGYRWTPFRDAVASALSWYRRTGLHTGGRKAT